MDLATTIGLPGGILAMVAGVIIEKLHIGMKGYLNLPGIILVVVGTAMATLASFTVVHMTKVVPQLMRIIFFNKPENTGEIIDKMIGFAQKARKEGLLALEADVETIEHPFFKKGMQLVVDGVDPELTKEILETEMANIEERHALGYEIFMTAGGFSPTFAIIGTVIGLVGALARMGHGDIMTTVHALGVAFMATFYGISFANLVLLPIANKLKVLHTEEAFVYEMMLTGILSIQAGDNPRILEERLKAFFSPKNYPRKEAIEERVRAAA